MENQWGVWLKRGILLTFILLAVLLILKLGVFINLSGNQAEKQKEFIRLTTVSSGEGIVEVFTEDSLVLRGNGTVDIAITCNLRIRLSCKDKNLIDNLKINGEEQIINKGQLYEIELKDITKDIVIEVGFISCNTIVVENAENYKVNVLGSEYSCKGKEKNQYIYFYYGQQIEIKLKPEKYWLLKKIHIDKQIYSLEQMAGLVYQNGEYSLVLKT